MNKDRLLKLDDRGLITANDHIPDASKMVGNNKKALNFIDKLIKDDSLEGKEADESYMKMIDKKAENEWEESLNAYIEAGGTFKADKT